MLRGYFFQLSFLLRPARCASSRVKVSRPSSSRVRPSARYSKKRMVQALSSSEKVAR